MGIYSRLLVMSALDGDGGSHSPPSPKYTKLLRAEWGSKKARVWNLWLLGKEGV